MSPSRPSLGRALGTGLSLLASAGLAASPRSQHSSRAATPVRSSQPATSLSAGNLTLRTHEHRAVLTSGFTFVRTDLRVVGDHAVADLRAGSGPLGGDLAQRIQHLVAEGGVHIESRDREADGDQAEYAADQRTVLLRGPPHAPGIPPPTLPAGPGPVLRDAAGVLSGEQILLHLDSDRVEVSGPHLALSARAPGPDGQVASTQVDSGALVLDQRHRVAQFRKDVRVRRGGLTVLGPRMDARYDLAGQITSLALRGGVELREGGRRATAQAADYDAVHGKVLLSGDPHLYDRGDVIQGDRMWLDLDSRDVKVEQLRGKVRPDAHQGETR